MKRTNTKITERRRGGAVNNALTVVIAFALLCIGVLLVSQQFGTMHAYSQEQQPGPVGSAQIALDAIREAELALAAENYGKARDYLAQARNALAPSSEEPVSQHNVSP